jgi:hypothetical protein
VSAELVALVLGGLAWASASKAKPAGAPPPAPGAATDPAVLDAEIPAVLVTAFERDARAAEAAGLVTIAGGQIVASAPFVGLAVREAATLVLRDGGTPEARALVREAAKWLSPLDSAPPWLAPFAPVVTAALPRAA